MRQVPPFEFRKIQTVALSKEILGYLGFLTHSNRKMLSVTTTQKKSLLQGNVAPDEDENRWLYLILNRVLFENNKRNKWWLSPQYFLVSDDERMS